ncbi:MAG: leucine-rich repeat domain-containing protein [Chitinispirillaceae bacterium]|nr:leucine-rich repeat domain-containing protein [Chitinispirillaceae bacterium]
MKQFTLPIRSGFLIASLLWGCGFAAIDPYDSTVVRTILDRIGWADVAVASVVSSAIAISGVEPARVTTLNLSLRSGLKPITELPSEISQLPELVTLSLKGNALTGLPDTVSTLHKLSRFDLSSNPLYRLPEAIGGLPLQVLTVNHCALDSLPAWIDTLSRLQSASFVGDSIITLPASIARLQSLATLNLDSNRLVKLPDELTALTGLKIGVNGNRLCSVDSSVARWLDNYQIGTDWRAAQQCDSKITSTITDPTTGTVVHVAADNQKISADCRPVQVTAVDASLYVWPGAPPIKKAVEVRFNVCFNDTGSSFLISFSLEDEDIRYDMVPEIYHKEAGIVSYIGGTIDSMNKTISVRATRQGLYFLALNSILGVWQKGLAVVNPAPQVRFALRHRFLEASFTLERPSNVRLRLFALNGQLIAEKVLLRADAGMTTLRLDPSSPRSTGQAIVELLTGEFRIVRTLQNF